MSDTTETRIVERVAEKLHPKTSPITSMLAVLIMGGGSAGGISYFTGDSVAWAQTTEQVELNTQELIRREDGFSKIAGIYDSQIRMETKAEYDRKMQEDIKKVQAAILAELRDMRIARVRREGL